MGSHGRTSYTSNMFSLKLVLCVCIFFVIGMEAAPKPKPKAEPKPQPKAEPRPQPKAEPKPFPPIRYPPHSGSYQGANPGPWNWNGFPPTRGDYPWQRNWNRLQMNRGDRYYPWQRNLNRARAKMTQPINSDPKRCNDLDGYKYYSYGKLEKQREELWEKHLISISLPDGAGCFDKNGCQPGTSYSGDQPARDDEFSSVCLHNLNSADFYWSQYPFVSTFMVICYKVEDCDMTKYLY